MTIDLPKKDAVQFICPFCKKDVFAGFDVNDVGTVLHGEPPCKEFLENEPDEFLHIARMRMSE